MPVSISALITSDARAWSKRLDVICTVRCTSTRASVRMKPKAENWPG